MLALATNTDGETPKTEIKTAQTTGII